MSVAITAIAPDFILAALQQDDAISDAGARGFHNKRAPQVSSAAEREALYPCVLIQTPAWEWNSFGNGGIITRARARYPVVAVGFLHQIEQLHAISSLMPARLHSNHGPAPNGGFVTSCAWLRPVDTTETVGDLTFLYVGDLYRLSLNLYADMPVAV